MATLKQGYASGSIKASTPNMLSLPKKTAAPKYVSNTTAQGIMTDNATWFRNNYLSQPTRAPGGAGVTASINNSPKTSAPGVVSQTLKQAANALIHPETQPGYVPPSGPGTQQMMGTAGIGGTTMGILDSAKAYATSKGGKALIGGAVAAVTGGSTSSSTSTSRAVNPNTGRPYRRMNPANGKAVRRAMRRVSSFHRMARNVEKQLSKYSRRK